MLSLQMNKHETRFSNLFILTYKYIDYCTPHLDFSLFHAFFVFGVAPAPAPSVHKVHTPGHYRFVYNRHLLSHTLLHPQIILFYLLFIVICSPHFCKKAYMNSNNKTKHKELSNLFGPSSPSLLGD